MQEVEAPRSGPGASRVPREGGAPFERVTQEKPGGAKGKEGMSSEKGGEGRGENAQENSAENL